MRVVAWTIDPRLFPSLARTALWHAASDRAVSAGQLCLIGAPSPPCLSERTRVAWKTGISVLAWNLVSAQHIAATRFVP